MNNYFLVGFSMDGYDTSEAERQDAPEYIFDALDSSGTSCQVYELSPEQVAELLKTAKRLA